MPALYGSNCPMPLAKFLHITSHARTLAEEAKDWLLRLPAFKTGACSQLREQTLASQRFLCLGMICEQCCHAYKGEISLPRHCFPWWQNLYPWKLSEAPGGGGGKRPRLQFSKRGMEEQFHAICERLWAIVTTQGRRKCWVIAFKQSPISTFLCTNICIWIIIIIVMQAAELHFWVCFF